jgi:hypothetical protein
MGPGNRRPNGSGKAAGEDGWEERENQMSKGEGGRNSSFSEKPVRSRLRRLADWIHPTGAKKVHSLIDKVYKRKNLEMAWEKVKENRGSGGVDGQSLEAFEAQLNQQLDRLHRELKEDTYQPLPVRQHPIPKRDKPGEYRMLGIPAIFDRVCQQALLNQRRAAQDLEGNSERVGVDRGRRPVVPQASKNAVFVLVITDRATEMAADVADRLDLTLVFIEENIVIIDPAG